jgi:hypothetical protein
MHEINTYRADHVCPHVSNREPLDGILLNLVRTLCHWRLPQIGDFFFPVIRNTNMVDERTCDLGTTLYMGFWNMCGKRSSKDKQFFVSVILCVIA